MEPSETLSGHTGFVEDIVFNPLDDRELVSVGQDWMVLFWDTWTGMGPI